LIIGVRREGSDERTATRPCSSLDNFGYEIKPGFRFRRHVLECLVAVRLGDDVFAQALYQVLGVRHRLDTAGVHRLHLLDQGKNPVQLGEHPLRFRYGNLYAGQMGDALDLL
jgi:hypothetical protein